MISVVMCSVEDERFASAERAYARLLRENSFEIIRITDARGLAEGYNRGLDQSRGDWVIFSHDDVEFLAPDFANRLTNHMACADVLGVVGTHNLVGPEWFSAGPPYLYGQIAGPRATDANFVVNHFSVPFRRIDKMQALDGVFLCVRRAVSEAVRFDDQTFDGFHLYDIDFSYRAFQQGFRASVACDLFPLHRSHGAYGPEWERYARAFSSKFRLPPDPHRKYTGAAVVASTREQIVAAMTHSHWDD